MLEENFSEKKMNDEMNQEVKKESIKLVLKGMKPTELFSCWNIFFLMMIT